MKRSLTYRVAALAASLTALSLLTGCGGSEVDGIIPVANPLPSASAYAGTYRSTVALPEGRTGTTNIVVAANGTCTGTLTVAGGSQSRQATAFSFGAGTYAISGTVNPTTGAFQMTGNISGQSFSYSGTLPTPGNGNVGGSYSLTAGGQTYTGSFAGGSGTVTPNPTPTPTPSASPGGTSTSAASLTFSNVSVPGVDLSPITTANLKADSPVAALFFNYDGTESSMNVTITSSTGTNTLDVRTLTLVLSNTGFPAGSAFGVTEPGTIATKAVAVFRQIGFSPFKSVGYGAKSGKTIIVNRSATAITLRLENVTFAGDASNSDDGLTGSFTVNGEITCPLTAPFKP